VADDAEGGGVMDGAMLDADSAIRPDQLDDAVAKDRARRAARRVATAALDADDCALLLDALGLTAEEGKQSA
jgi:hypothetical protein